MKTVSVCAFGIALLFHSAVSQAQQMVLASGPKGSLYDHLVHELGRHLEDPQHPPVQVVPSFDATESLRWIAGEENADGKVRFAFVRQDLLAHHFRSLAGTPVRVVGKVAYEYLHIVVREDLYVRYPGDLARQRIWTGEDGSALKFTTSHILDTLGVRLEQPLTYRDIENSEPGDAWVNEYATQHLPDWFANGKLDAAVIMAPAGSPEISAMIMRGRCSLLPLDRPTLLGLASQQEAKGRFLRHIAFGMIPGRSYLNQDEPLSTVAVPLLLVTRADTDRVLALKVLSAARQEWKSIGTPAPRPWQSETLPQSDLKFLDGINPSNPPLDKALTGLLAVMLTMIAAWFAPARLRAWLRLAGRQIRSFYQHYLLLCVVAQVLVAGMLIITLLIYLVERNVNENFSTLWESWWSITIYIFSGLEDRVPRTPAGHVLVALGLLLGAICSTVLTGWTTAFFIRRERKMPPKLQGHCLLLNWNERGTELVRELHHPVLRKSGRTLAIVVLTDDPSPSLEDFKQHNHPLEEAFEDVYLRVG